MHSPLPAGRRAGPLDTPVVAVPAPLDTPVGVPLHSPLGEGPPDTLLGGAGPLHTRLEAPLGSRAAVLVRLRVSALTTGVKRQKENQITGSKKIKA